ncbi:YoaK family protein [Williamsia sp. R60]
MLSHRRQEVALAAALTGVAGAVDAIGFLSLGGFFVSFMSGNTTRAGAALAAGDLNDFALAAGLIVSFVAGVIAGSVVGHIAGRCRRAAVLGLVALVLAASFSMSVPDVTGAVAAPLLAVAMGAENAVFEAGGEVRIGLTYMTGTLVKMGQNMAQRLMGTGQRATWPRHGALWAGMGAGACSGAGAYELIGFASVACAAALTSIVAIAVVVLDL